MGHNSTVCILCDTLASRRSCVRLPRAPHPQSGQASDRPLAGKYALLKHIAKNTGEACRFAHTFFVNVTRCYFFSSFCFSSAVCLLLLSIESFSTLTEWSASFSLALTFT